MTYDRGLFDRLVTELVYADDPDPHGTAVELAILVQQGGLSADLAISIVTGGCYRDLVSGPDGFTA